MEFDNVIDIATAVAAIAAALVSLWSVYLLKKDNAKKDMLNHYTKERLENVHEIKKWAGVLLNEAMFATINVEHVNKTERVHAILEAFNNLWFLLKPVYEIDIELQEKLVDLTSHLICYYSHLGSADDGQLKDAIVNISESFRIKSFLYAHSGWTCVKNQILHGEKSSYCEFERAHKNNKEAIEKKIAEGNDCWLIEKSCNTKTN